MWKILEIAIIFYFCLKDNKKTTSSDLSSEILIYCGFVCHGTRTLLMHCKLLIIVEKMVSTLVEICFEWKLKKLCLFYNLPKTNDRHVFVNNARLRLDR